MPSQLYLVICGSKEPYVAERNLEDMTRERTISDLAAGEWNSIDGARFMVSSIIEVGTDKDVTDEFINAARMMMDSYREPNHAWRADHERDYRKHSQAAE